MEVFILTLTLKKIMPVESGVSNSGREWKKAVAVFSTFDERETSVAVTFRGNIMQVLETMVCGNVYGVTISAESREWNGKFFTDLYAMNIALIQQQKQVQQMQQVQQVQQVQQQQQNVQNFIDRLNSPSQQQPVAMEELPF